YLETFAEEGIPGLVLLVVALGAILAGTLSAAVRARYDTRTQAAAATAACLAFLISAAVDWVWQLPVLPCAFFLLGAATLVPTRPRPVIRSDLLEANGAPSSAEGPARSWPPIARRVTLAVIALACLFAIGLPLAETTALRASQAAAGSGATATALADAETAARLEPGAATPQLQLALVLETQN